MTTQSEILKVSFSLTTSKIFADSLNGGRDIDYDYPDDEFDASSGTRKMINSQLGTLYAKELSKKLFGS